MYLMQLMDECIEKEKNIKIKREAYAEFYGDSSLLFAWDKSKLSTDQAISLIDSILIRCHQ